MDCCLKEKDLNKSLLKDIELQPYNISKSDNELVKKHIIREKVPWQFFLDTHTHRDDIGWWKKRVE